MDFTIVLQVRDLPDKARAAVTAECESSPHTLHTHTPHTHSHSEHEGAQMLPRTQHHSSVCGTVSQTQQEANTEIFLHFGKHPHLVCCSGSV